jgi:hypothetical protein
VVAARTLRTHSSRSFNTKPFGVRFKLMPRVLRKSSSIKLDGRSTFKAAKIDSPIFQAA